MGGTLGGIRFGPAGKRADGTIVNQLEVDVQEKENTFTITGPELDIVSIDMFLGQSKLRIGQSRLQGLSIKGFAPPAGQKGQLTIKVAIQHLDFEDLLFVQTDSMKGAAAVAVDGMTAKLDQLKQDDGPSFHLPVPLIGPALDLLLSRVDRLIAIAGKAASSFTSDQPVAVGVELDVGAIQVRGLTTSAGQQVDSVFVKDLHLRYAQDEQKYFDYVMESLERRIADARTAGDEEKVKTLEAKREEAQKAKEAAVRDDARIAELERKESPSEEEQKELEKLRAAREQRRAGGAVLDATGIIATGVHGGTTADYMSARGIHGEGSGPGMSFAPVTLQSLAGGMPAGATNPEEAKQNAAQGTKIGVTVESVDSRNIQARTDVPTQSEVEKAIADLEAEKEKGPLTPGKTEALDRLKVVLQKVIAYEALIREAHDTWAESERMKTLRAEIDAKRAELTEDLFRIRGHLRLNNVEVAGGTNELGQTVVITAAGMSAEEVEVGQTKIKRVVGRGVAITGEAKGGVPAMFNRDRIVGAGVAAESVELEGYRDSKRLVALQRIHLGGIGAVVAANEGNATAEGEVREILVNGVDLAGTLEMMRAERDRLAEIPKDKLTDEEKQREVKIGVALQDRDLLEAQVAEAQKAYDKAQGPQKAAAQKALKAAVDKLAAWGRTIAEVHAVDLTIKLSGLGNVFAKGYDPSAEIKTLEVEVGLGELEAKQVDWQGDRVSVKVEQNAKLSGVTAKVTYDFPTKKRLIPRLHIDELSGVGIHVRQNAEEPAADKAAPGKPAEERRFDLARGALRNIELTDFDYDAMKGRLSIGKPSEDVQDPQGRVIPGMECGGAPHRARRGAQAQCHAPRARP
ncbi:MAG: hypothetical protein QM820_15310 [Minicystis sp.]